MSAAMGATYGGGAAPSAIGEADLLVTCWQIRPACASTATGVVGIPSEGIHVGFQPHECCALLPERLDVANNDVLRGKQRACTKSLEQNRLRLGQNLVVGWELGSEIRIGHSDELGRDASRLNLGSWRVGSTMKPTRSEQDWAC